MKDGPAIPLESQFGNVSVGAREGTGGQHIWVLSPRRKDKPTRYGQRYRLSRISKLIEYPSRED
jgi:hypothetical protein